MITSIDIITGEEEIITLELAKLHLRVDSDYTEEDPLINLAIGSARVESEGYIGRKLVAGSVVIQMSGFTDFSNALQSVNDAISSIEYYKPGDTDKTVLSTDLYTSTKTYLYLNVAFKKDGLPEVDDRDDAVIVTIAFGYDKDSCPKDVMSAMLLQIAESYDKRENRTALHQSAVRNLLDPYRKWQ